MKKGCVNIHHPEFVRLSLELNLSPTKLEDIVHAYQLREGQDKFPSSLYIRKKLTGKSVQFGESSYKLWKKEYSEPVRVSELEIVKAARRARAVFPAQAVSIYKNLDGNWTISVAMPLNHRNYDGTRESRLDYLRGLRDTDNQVSDFTYKLVSDYYDGADHFMVTIPSNSRLTNAEAIKEAQQYFESKVSSNRGIKRDFRVGSELHPRYSNGKVIGYGIRITAHQEALEARRNPLEWDAARHERELVDPYLREQWEREYEGEEDSEKFTFDFVKLREKENWTMLRGEEILAELPTEVREGVAKSITEYSEAKNRGEIHSEASSIYFPEGKTKRTASEVLDDIIKNSPDAEIVRLAKIARKSLKTDTPVTFKPGSSGDPRGRYHTDGTISIYRKATKGESVEDATRGLERTIVHEIIHAITVDAIQTNKALREEIAGIMGQLQDYLKQNGIDNWVYALKNEKEFIAEFMSQPFFREALKHMPSKINNKPSNFFQRVINAIKTALGIKGRTLFDEANSVYNHILNTEAKDEVIDRIEDLAEEAQELTEQEQSKSQDKMLEQIHTINRQFNRILESKALTSTDLAEVSEVIADMISSKIDEMEAKRDQVKEILVQRNPNDDTDVNKLSRFELIKALGIQHFIDLVKQDFVRNKRTAAAENRVKITEVVKNWDYFINRIKSTISETEGIHLEVDAVGERTVVVDEALTDQYEEDGSNVQDQVEDGQLSWQVENNTIDPITSMTQLVKLQLRELFQLKDNGRRDEEGNPLYDHIRTKWGTDAKVGHVKAAKCLLKWLNGKQTLREMVEVLQEKSKRNPWVTQLLPKLMDTTGRYTTEQSQFFSTFYKPFMKFTNVGTKGEKLTSRQLNEHPFLTLTMKTIEAAYKLGQHPLVANGLTVGAKALNNHYTKLQELVRDFETNKEQIFDELRAVTKGLGFEINVAELQLEREEVTELMHQLNIINTAISRNADNVEYDPFAYGKGKDGVRSNFMRFFERLTDSYEDEAVTSFYEGGKMRQSYLLPSFLTMFTNKFHLNDQAFFDFVKSEFDTEFMRDLSFDDIRKGWNNVWLQHMMSDAKKRLNFNCKTSITFNGSTYMRGMSKEEYALAMITEFFGENSKETDSLFLANFRVPIESNKPSAEYITFYARGGAFYKEDLVGDFLKVFNQEISRIKTVLLREKSREESLKRLEERYKNGDITAQQYEALVYSINQEAITNFDSRGKKFVYLDFLNREVEESTELGKLIEEATKGKKVDTAEMSKKAAEAIRTAIQERVNRMIETFKQNGVFELCKTIEKIGNSNEAVQKKLELMLWNDAFASTQIMQLLITDPAFLKNTDDVQKRFAQVHASGTRANLAAVDFEGHEVSDGVHRSITLKDVEGFTSNIIENLTIVLDKKIANSKSDSERVAWEAFKDKLVGEKGLYRTGINLTDAQAYSCPTSYRKKALMFGLWSKEAEATYNRIKDGTYTYSDVVSVFQPFKPFVYGNSIESTGVNAEGAMTKMRVPVQNKNAECLLVMADAILAGEETGKPNLLRALFQVMEDSHYDTVMNEDGSVTRTYKTDGIDTVNFESAVKSGAQGRIDTQAYAEGREITITDKEGKEQQRVITPEAAFKSQLKSLIYKTEIVNGKEVTTYNRTSVKHLSFENYCMQQSVPEHFLDHSQLEGSQQRALIPSDLATVDEAGNTVYYEVGEGKTKMTAAELREKYDRLHAENIQKGIEEVENLFMLKESTPQQRKEALSKLLVEQFLRDGRYSGDMLYMVTLNEETGDFPVSLEDPSIRTQVEQAINSIIKSRVNKLKMKGGPLVQMSNFGMSKELKIRFLDKEGNPLKDRSEFDSDEAYKEYVTKNQGGISHFEVIAPAYTEAIFKEFMDKEGNISIEALEMLSPDLLKMIGYRIPTEAKYSIAPLKIVGFAPREMGDVIILPAEITLVTGSDFDVDKEYCIRKALGIKPKYPKMSPERRGSKFAEVIIPAEANHTRRETVRMFADEFVNNPYDRKYWTSPTGGKLSDAEYTSFLKSYLDTFYVLDPATGVDANNNEIFDMSYAVLTSESNVARALKPGGFDEHKQIAYAVAAYRLPEVRAKYSFDALLKMGNKEVGKLIERADKNLVYLDTQLEYYDHNNSASSLLGISAVNSVAHAILVDDNIGIDLTGIAIPTIAGFKFGQVTSSFVSPTTVNKANTSKEETQWARTAANSYEVSTQGDSRFSALRARFKPGTIIDGVDVGDKTIEYVYQTVIKKSSKGRAPSIESKLYRPELKTKAEQEDFSYREGYLPLWQEWARQNPELIQELREKSAGKVLTDKFANTRVSQARALADILNSETSTNQNTSTVTKIISGGQTGVDTIGLQVAKSLGIETGGTAPKGFLRERGIDNEDISSYGLIEISDEQQADYTNRKGKRDPYTGRTELNVRNSDGTVYFSTASDSAGKIATKRAADEFNKPFIENPTAEELRNWINKNGIKTLNVAGNRGSKLNNGPEIANIIKEALTSHKAAVNSYTGNLTSVMRLDPSTAADGASIAETLGSNVAASADAAKDPVLNFMNLNPQTFNVYTTLIRLGMPNSVATLLMSSKVLADAVTKSNAKALAGEWSTPESVLREQLTEEALKEVGYLPSSTIFSESISRDELIRGLHEDDVNINLKIANALVFLFDVSKKVRLADQITRFNSTSSAVGPTTLDNYVFQNKLNNLDENSSLVDMREGMVGRHIGVADLLGRHKMLAQFSRAYDLANQVLVDQMPQTRAFIRSIEGIYSTPTGVRGLDVEYGLPAVVVNDRATLGKLREFFTSWTAMKNGLVSYKELDFLSREFPKTLTTKKVEHQDNYLVQNLYLNIDNRSGFPIIAMNISKIEKSARDMLSASWADLYAKDREFAMNLFKYSFFRGGLGFSPKTFMNVLPIQMKTDIEGYLQLFKDVEPLSIEESNLMYKQFISNNYLNNKLVPVKSRLKPREDGRIIISKKDSRADSFKNVRYFKTQNENGSYTLYECVGGFEEGPAYRIYAKIPMLGAEGNFIELSIENIKESIFDVKFDLEDTGNQKLTPDVNDVPAEKLKTLVEARKMLDEVLSQSQQQKTKDMVAKLTGEAKKVFVQRLSTRLSTILEQKGYNTVELDTFNEMLKQLDLC